MICRTCGYNDTSNAMEKRVERGGSQECASCTAKPAVTIKSAYGVCRPWRGDFDDNDNPLDTKGRLYRPGIRLCGNRDCVARNHIDGNQVTLAQVEELEAERHSIAYRTGVRLTYKQLLAKVIREGTSGRDNNPRAGN